MREQLQQLFATLRFRGMAQVLDRTLDQAEKEDLPVAEVLLQLLQEEWRHRQERALASPQTNFPCAATGSAFHSTSGSTFSSVEVFFQDALSLTYSDPDHSIEEDRFLIIGISSLRNILVISHTFRNDNIRIISARKATKKERDFCENESRRGKR